MRLQLLLPALVLTALCSCGKAGDRDATNANTGSVDTAQLAPAAPATSATTAATQDTVRPVVTQTAVISTTAGDIEVELYGQDAPKTVKNFVELAKRKYYDGLAFHRVVPGFVIQGGDPLSKDTTQREKWGSGGESIYGKTFEDELDPNSPSGRRGYREGTLAMANAGPNTNGSQFFIVLSTEGARHLTYNYTIFGAVTKGMDVAHKIEQLGMNGEAPSQPVRMKTITVKDVSPSAPSTGTTK
jgi:cyclophilin family peptidyl-prolyl cis-trans isomerase